MYLSSLHLVEGVMLKGWSTLVMTEIVDCTHSCRNCQKSMWRLLNIFWNMFTSWWTDSMRQSTQKNAECQLPTIHFVSTILTFQNSKCQMSTPSVPSKQSIGLRSWSSVWQISNTGTIFPKLTYKNTQPYTSVEAYVHWKVINCFVKTVMLQCQQEIATTPDSILWTFDIDIHIMWDEVILVHCLISSMA